MQTKFDFQENCSYAFHNPEAISEARALPNRISSEQDSIIIACNSNSSAGFANNFDPSDTLISTSSPSRSLSDITSPSSSQPGSPSDCGTDSPDFGFSNNNNIIAANGVDGNNESNEAEDNYADVPDYPQLAQNTAVSR